MATIKHLLSSKINSITKSDDPMVRLPYELYEIVYNFMDKIISYDWMGENS